LSLSIPYFEFASAQRRCKSLCSPKMSKNPLPCGRAKRLVLQTVQMTAMKFRVKKKE